MKTILTICAMLFIIACTKQKPITTTTTFPIVKTNNVTLGKFANIVWTLKEHSYSPDYKLVPYLGNIYTKTFYKDHTSKFYINYNISYSTWQVLNDSTIATLDTTCLNYESIYCHDKTYINMPNDTNLYLWTYDIGAKKILMHFTGKY